MEKKKLLEELNFGNVDSESEEALDKIFIQTDDFVKFLDEKTSVIIGAKGAGKSALFRLFSDFEEEARKRACEKLDSVILLNGIGFKDVPNMDMGTIYRDMKEEKIDFRSAWNIYVMYKLVYQLYAKENIVAGPNSKTLLIRNGSVNDNRFLGLLKRLYEKLIGDAPKVDEISFSDFSVKISKNKKISSDEVLKEINEELGSKGKKVWLLLDKIDELFSDKSDIRKNCIEGLFLTLIDYQSRYKNIKLKIFLRSDIWTELNFVNKSHLADKQVRLVWNEDDLKRMIIKRGCLNENVKAYVQEICGTDDLESKTDEAFACLFPRKAYSGEREATTIKYMMARIVDGQGGVYPRELINFCNESVKIEREQMETQSVTENIPPIVSGNSIVKAFTVVSTNKVNTFLSEFGSLKEHFKRFEGQSKAYFEKEELEELMEGLSPSGDDMIRQMYETGILKPSTSAVISPYYEIPRLFRVGLGMVIKGRA